MSATFFHIVDEHVARNPVARAVQRAKLAAAIREFQLQLYFLADDTPQNDNLMAAAKVIAVALRLHEVQSLPAHEANVLKGALSCIEHATARGCKWRSVDAPAIDSGIDRAAALVNRCTAQQVRDAWRFVEALEVTA